MKRPLNISWVYLKSNPDFKQKNIELFETELNDIGAVNPVIIAFGNSSFEILNKLSHKYKIYKVPHYSSCVRKEILKERFNEIANVM